MLDPVLLLLRRLLLISPEGGIPQPSDPPPPPDPFLGIRPVPRGGPGSGGGGGFGGFDDPGGPGFGGLGDNGGFNSLNFSVQDLGLHPSFGNSGFQPQEFNPFDRFSRPTGFENPNTPGLQQNPIGGPFGAPVPGLLGGISPFGGRPGGQFGQPQPGAGFGGQDFERARRRALLLRTLRFQNLASAGGGGGFPGAGPGPI